MIGNTGRRRISVLLFLCVAAIYALFAQGTVRSWDGATMLAVTRSIVLEGKLTVPPTCLGEYGPDGRYYAWYGVGQSLAAIPWFVAGQIAASMVSDNWGTDEVITEFAVSWFNPIVTVLTCVAVYFVCLQVGLSASVAAACALIYAFGTGAFVQMKDFNSEPLTGLLLLLAVYNWLRLRRTGGVGRVALVGLCVGAAITVRLASIVVLPILALGLVWIALEQGTWARAGKWLAAFAVPVIMCLAGIGLYNYVRFGDLLDTGYPSFAFQHSFWSGLGIQIISPTSGLIWYNPVVLLAPLGAALAWRQSRFITGTFGLLLVVHLFLYSVYDTPAGGHSIGNRFMLVVMPYLIIWVGFAIQGFTTRRWRTAIWALVAVSILVQLPLVYINPSYYFARLSAQRELHGLPSGEQAVGWWRGTSERFEESLLVQSWQISAEVTHNAVCRSQWLRSLAPRTPPGADAATLVAESRPFHLPYLWWVLAYYYGAPIWLVTAMVAVLIIANCLAWMVLRRSWPDNRSGQPERALT